MKVVFEDITINEEVPEEYRFSEEDVKEFVLNELEEIKDFIPLLMKKLGFCVYHLGDITVEFSSSGDNRLFFIVVEYVEGYVEGVQKRIEHAWGDVRIDGIGQGNTDMN